MLVQVREADHSFHVPARSHRTDAQVLPETLDAFGNTSVSAVPPISHRMSDRI
jgi:hypothetical protein